MHELAVTESVLEIALRNIPPGPPVRVTNIYLVIGQLSSIIDDSVQFYWDFVAEGTPAGQSKLHFRRIPAELTCRECHLKFGLNGQEFICPSCGSALVDVTAGEEFFMEAIEVETIPEAPASDAGPPGGSS